MSPTFFLFIILTVTMLFEALYVWWRNPKNPVNYLFGLSMFFLSTWPLIFVAIFTTNNYAFASFLDNAVYGIFALFFVFFLPLAILFPSSVNLTKKTKKLVVICSAVGIFFFIASFLDLVSGPLDPNYKITGPTKGPLAPFYIIYGLLAIITAAGYIIYHYRKTSGIEKRQILFVLSGFLFTLISAFFVGGALPLLLNSSQYAILGPFSIIFLVTFLAWAILKHHLFDLRVLASEVFAYLLIVLLLFPLFGSYVNFPTFLGRILLALSAIIVSLSFVRATANEKKKTNEILNLNQIIAAQNSRNEALLESINDGVFAVDLERKIILFNHRAEVLSGYRRDEVLGKKFYDFIRFIDDKNGEKQSTFIDEVIDNNRPLQLKKGVSLRQKNGRLLPVGDSASPVHDQQGKVIGAIIVFRDVEEERRVERMKDEFINIAAHELRDPMTAIKGFVSMLLGGDLGKVPKAQIEILQMTSQATERLLKLVANMLNASRLDAGKMRFELAKTPLTKAVKEAVKFYQNEAKSKHLKLKFEEPVASINKTTVMIDKDKIFQSLSNVIGNALKFTKKGAITLAMKREANFGVISITDTGVGIPEEEQRNLFQKFFRARLVGKTSSVGSGLGLYIAKKITEKHGGDLWLVSSKPGKGSTFALSLPIFGTPEEKKATAALVSESKTQEQKSFAKA